ncbi:uncharacterized protein B0I36DRAFT_399902, partial [Microdochium trichocladiopsis]
AICLEVLVDVDSVRRLKCKHLFTRLASTLGSKTVMSIAHYASQYLFQQRRNGLSGNDLGPIPRRLQLS